MTNSDRVVRVFISSTFRDMHAERDHLVTVVFPEMRERLERLGLEFFDVDLRWGVPDKDINGETANSWEYCRQWIERVEPLFICILGQRYGWVPEAHDLQDEADRARQAAAPRSITDLEVRHAVLNDRRKRRSYFYLRETPVPALPLDAPTESRKIHDEFVDPPERLEQLDALKVEIQRCERPVRNYRCQWTGQGFDNLDAFGRLVLDDLWSGVLRDPRYVSKEVWRHALGTDPETDPRYTDESHPVSSELSEKIVSLAKPAPVSLLDAERQQMEAFAAARLKWFQGRTRELETLTAFLHSTAENAPRLAVVVSVPGQGKSALLAKLWQSLHPVVSPITDNQSTITGGSATVLIAHFIGATEHSASALELVRRLLGELDRSGIEWPEGKADPEPNRDFFSLCTRLSKRLGEYAGQRRIVLLIDALNQLSDGHDLRWLPPQFGPGVRVVVSCVEDAPQSSEFRVPSSGFRAPRSESPVPSSGAGKGLTPEQRVLQALGSRQSGSVRIPLGPLTPQDVRIVVVDYFKEYCKELDAPHVKAFCALPQAHNPLYLLVALGELRTLGGNDMNRKVPALIASLSKIHPDTVSLFKWVLQRLEVFGAEEVKYWCLYLATGRVGMATRELADLLSRKLGDAAAAKAQLIERGLRRYLQRRGGQLDFFHGQLRQAVLERFGMEARAPSTCGDAAAQSLIADGTIAGGEAREPGRGIPRVMPIIWSVLRRVAGRGDRPGNPLRSLPCPPEHWRRSEPAIPLARLHHEMAEYFTVCAEGNDPQKTWETEAVRGFSECVYHFTQAKDYEKARKLLGDFPFLLHKIRVGLLEGVFEDYESFRSAAPGDEVHQLELPAAFFREKAHFLRRGDDRWPAHKIFLQLAFEHADDSPLTRGAEQWLVAGRCDWAWLRRNRRLPHAQINPCLAVLEGHSSGVDGALLLPDGQILSWAGGYNSNDHTLRLWDSRSGRCLAGLEGHSGYINGALVLPDGRILSWARDKTLRLWDSQSGKCLTVLEGHLDSVTGALVLPDGRILSWSWKGKELRRWDSQSGKCLTVLEGHSGNVDDALVLPEGRILSWGQDELRVWDSNSGRCLVSIGKHSDKYNDAAEGQSDKLKGALTLPDGRILLWEGKKLHLWDREMGNCLTNLDGHSKTVMGALVLPDGRILSWGGNDLRFWDSQSGHCVAILEGHSHELSGVRLLPDGRILSHDGETVRLWDGHSGDCLTVLEGHSDSIAGALLLPDGRILSWAADKTLGLWDSQSGDCLAVLEGHADSIAGALVLPEGRILSWAGRSLRVWDSTSGASLAVLEGHSSAVSDIRTLPDGRILSWSGDHTLRVWDSTSGDCLAVLKGHLNSINDALLLPEGRVLSWSAEDRTLRLWDSQSWNCLAVLQKHSSQIDSVLLLPGDRILSMTRSYELCLWNSHTGELVAALDGHSSHIGGVLVLPDSRILSWAEDKTLRLWDSQSGKCLAVLEGHSTYIKGAHVLPDGRILSWAGKEVQLIGPYRGILSLSGNKPPSFLADHQATPAAEQEPRSKDHTPRIWDGRSGQCLAVLEGHSGVVTGVLVLRDGRILSWSEDNTLRLWDSTSGHCTAVLKGHSGEIGGALIMPDGRILSWSGGFIWSDHNLRVWDCQSGECLAVLEGHSSGILRAKVLPDGRILSEAHDKTLRLWDSRSGNCLAVLGHSDHITDTLALPDGRILSWTWDGTLRLWDNQGSLTAVYSIDEGPRLFPEFRPIYRDKDKYQSHCLWDNIAGVCLLRLFENEVETRFNWQGDSACTGRLLQPDGRAILTQANGQVCFLQLYHGNHPISIDELEVRSALRKETPQ